MKKTVFETPNIESQTIEELSQQLLATSAKLYETNLHLEKVQREREEMLANISHDLRAPITAIRNTVDYLCSGQEISPEDRDSALQLIDRRTKTLENLIQDMYYLFCIEDTSKALDMEIIPVAPFLEEYFFDTLANSRYNGYELHLDLPETLNCNIRIDVQKMIRVLDNLFTNAAKYSEKGSDITLKAQLSPDGQVLQISVIDTGMGIPADALPYIFNRTYTVSSARTPNSATGSGLGLSIVDAIVARLSGTITCESTEGEGSTFCISLPIANF